MHNDINRCVVKLASCADLQSKCEVNNAFAGLVAPEVYDRYLQVYGGDEDGQRPDTIIYDFPKNARLHGPPTVNHGLETPTKPALFEIKGVHTLDSYYGTKMRGLGRKLVSK